MSNEPVNHLFGPSREEDEIVSLRAFLQVIYRRFWVLLAVSVLFVAIAVGSSLMQTQQYTASIKVLIGQKSSAEPTYAPTLPSLAQLTFTMAEAVDSRPIAEAVVKELDLKLPPDYVLANLSATPIEETQFIEVSYVDTNPERAQKVINAVGSTFSEEVSEISPSTNYVAATVWEPATNAAPVGTGLLWPIMLALVLGAIVGTGLAFVLEALDDSWQSPEELEQISGVPTFGVVPTFRL
jgi:capsular polysaccharide biosynthesis protein